MTGLVESELDGCPTSGEAAGQELDGWISEIRTFFTNTKTELDELVRTVEVALTLEPVESLEKPREATPPAPTQPDEAGTDRLELLKRRLTARIQEEDGGPSVNP